MMTGNYDTRDALVAAVKQHYTDEVPMAQIARETGVTLKCVRGIVAAEEVPRENRPIQEPPKPMSIKPHELRLVPNPCLSPYCEDPECSYHYAGGV